MPQKFGGRLGRVWRRLRPRARAQWRDSEFTAAQLQTTSFDDLRDVSVMVADDNVGLCAARIIGVDAADATIQAEFDGDWQASGVPLSNWFACDRVLRFACEEQLQNDVLKALKAVIADEGGPAWDPADDDRLEAGLVAAQARNAKQSAARKLASEKRERLVRKRQAATAKRFANRPYCGWALSEFPPPDPKEPLVPERFCTKRNCRASATIHVGQEFAFRPTGVPNDSPVLTRRVVYVASLSELRAGGAAVGVEGHIFGLDAFETIGLVGATTTFDLLEDCHLVPGGNVAAIFDPQRAAGLDEELSRKFQKSREAASIGAPPPASSAASSSSSAAAATPAASSATTTRRDNVAGACAAGSDEEVDLDLDDDEEFEDAVRAPPRSTKAASKRRKSPESSPDAFRPQSSLSGGRRKRSSASIVSAQPAVAGDGAAAPKRRRHAAAIASDSDESDGGTAWARGLSRPPVSSASGARRPAASSSSASAGAAASSSSSAAPAARKSRKAAKPRKRAPKRVAASSVAEEEPAFSPLRAKPPVARARRTGGVSSARVSGASLSMSSTDAATPASSGVGVAVVSLSPSIMGLEASPGRASQPAKLPKSISGPAYRVRRRVH